MTDKPASDLPALPEPRYWWEPTPESGLLKYNAGWSTNTGPAPDWLVTHYYTTEQVRAIQEAAFNAGRAEAASGVGFLITQAWLALTEPMPKVLSARYFLTEAIEALTPPAAISQEPK